VPATAFVDTVPGADAAESQGEREARRRRRRRGGRDRDEAREAAPVEGLNGNVAEPTEAVDAEAAVIEAEAAPVAGEAREGGRRRRGGRGRERREPVAGEEAAVDSAVELAGGEPLPRAATQQPAPTPTPAPVVAAPTPIPTPAAPPKVKPFVLPTDELRSVAEGAGLEWVNSDVEKIRAVQEAIANEPKPIHVPRERKPVAVIDEGPLVLIETRKDLSQFKLPFEAGSSQPSA